MKQFTAGNTGLKNKRLLKAASGKIFTLFCTLLILFIIISILANIIFTGSEVLSLEFLVSMPRERMTQGGILPCILGTFYVTLITTVFSLPFGVGTAIYLNEYAKDNMLTRIIRLAIRNLSGVPSIVYGIFGVALFVDSFGLGKSILASGLTLGLLTLPWTITASEEALKSVPMSYREGALALGATKWYAIRTNVLPNAIPGILTGAILGIARAAGETAPILFTGAVFFMPDLPYGIFDRFMSLPYHIYILATQHEKIIQVRPIAYGTALVLIMLVFLMSLTAIIIRTKMRKKNYYR